MIFNLDYSGSIVPYSDGPFNPPKIPVLPPIIPGPVRGMEPRSLSQGVLAWGQYLGEGIGDRSVRGLTEPQVAIDRGAVQEALEELPWWGIEPPGWAASPDRMGAVIPGSIVSDDPGRASEEPFPEVPPLDETASIPTGESFDPFRGDVLAEPPMAPGRSSTPGEATSPIGSPVPTPDDQQSDRQASPEDVFGIPGPTMGTPEAGGPVLPPASGGEERPMSWIDGLLGGLGEIAGEIVPGLILDRVGIGADAPWERRSPQPYFPNSIPNVLGFPDPWDVLTGVTIDNDTQQPIPESAPVGNLPVSYRMGGYYGRDQVLASGNPAQFCIAGQTADGALVFRRRRRRRAKKVTATQWADIHRAVATFGKSSQNTSLMISKILS